MSNNEELEEAALRTAADGIPRYVRSDGKIMKCDWILSDDAVVAELEDHIASLLFHAGHCIGNLCLFAQFENV